MEDITKTGPRGHTQLQAENDIDFIEELTPEMRESFINSPMPLRNILDYSKLNLSPRQEDVGNITSLYGFGHSKYDNEINSFQLLESLENIRSENQPWYDLIANSVAKGGVLAGTTFLSGTVGLVAGIGTSIVKGDISGLWDNGVTNILADINEYSEEKLANHRTDAEQEGPWYNNIFTANFLGESIIKNMGFMVGAFYSGGLASKAFAATGLATKAGTGALNAMNATNKVRANMGFKEILNVAGKAGKVPAHITSAVGASVAAVAEGSIEAINNSRQWYDAEEERIGLKRDNNIAKIKLNYSNYPEMVEKLIEEENLAHDNSMAEAAMNRTKMGNMDLAFNLPVLWASGMTQFARQFSGGFKTARRANNIVGEAGKMVSKTGKVGHKIGRSALNSLAEGFEELGQETGNIISGTHYSHVNDSFYAQQLNPEAELEAVSLINSMGEGFKETMSKGESWEQFWVGAFSSALGMPMFGKKNNNQSWIGKNKAFGFTGGAIGEYQSLTQEAKDEQKIIDYVNNTINSGKGKEYYKGMIRSLASEKRMEKAAADNDQYEYKNAEHNQLVSDITMFDNAGAMEDLLALVESSDLKSDELLDALIVDLTVENEDGTFSGPFTDKQGNKQTDTKVNREKMKLKLNEKTEHVKQTIDNYLKIKDDLDVSTGLVLSNEQLSEIVWLKSQVLNWDKRAEEMGEVNKGLLTNLSESVSRRINYYDDHLVAMAKADQSNFTTEKELVDEELTGEEITAGVQPKKVDSKVVYFDGNKLTKSEVEDIGKIVEHLEQIEIINSWTKLSAVEMSDRLGNEELNNALQNLFTKMVADGTSVVIEDAKTFKDNSQDLIKLHKSKAMYNQRLKQYLENPGLIAEAIVNKYQEELDNQIMEKVKNFPEVTTHAEFKAAIELMPDAMYGKVLENLLDSDNEILLKLAQDHENFTNGKIIFRTLFESDPNSERYNLISSGVITAFENAETLEGALKLWADSKAGLVNNDKELGVIYDELLTAFTEAKASLDKLNDDRNIARKTAKKKAAEAPKAKTGIAKGLENAVTGVSNVVTGTKNILAGKKYNAKGEDITDESSEDTPVSDKDDVETEEADTVVEEEVEEEAPVEVETPVLEHDSFVASDPAVVPKNESKKAKSERFKREVKETETSNESPDLKQASNLTGFRSWNRETKYDFSSLSDKSTRKMKIYLEGRAITEKLDELGVQRFIDTGKLAALVDANPDTVIHYIKPKDSVYGDRILLAIEVTPETLRIAKSENAISANNTQYQVVGVLGFNGGVKGVAMNKLNAIVSHMMHEGTKSSDNYVVSSKYTNKVAHMYSGRMVKSTEAEGVSTKSVTRAFLDKGEGDAVPFRLGFYYKEGDFKTPGLDPQNGDKVESVNLHNANKKDGSLWLMVQEADGVWYPKYVGVRRFTEGEYSLAEHADKPLMVEIQEAIEIILDPQSNDAQRMTAKGIVERTLYWKNGTEGKSESFLRHNFNKKTGVVDLIVGDKAFVAQGETLSEQAMSVMTALQSDELNLRFQIHHGLMGESSYENKILDSEILTTDLHQPRNVNGSFDLFLNDPKTGAPIETDAPGNYGHSGRKSRQNSLDKKRVTSLGNRYLIDEKSGVVTNLKGEVIKDGKTLDHIRLSMLMSDPKVSPMRGSDLYMSNYTEGGELFGIIGKKLLTGQPLQDKLVEIKAKQDDMDRRAALKKEKAEAEKLKAHNYVKGYKVSDDGKTVVISANSAKGGTFLIHYSKDGGLTIVQNIFSEEGNAKPKINMSPNLTQLVIDKFVSPEVKALFEKYKNDLNNAEFKNELNKLDAASKLKLSDDGIPILPDPIVVAPVTTVRTIELIDEDIALEEDKKRRELLDVPTNDYSEYSQQGLVELINSFHPNFIPSNSKLHYNNKIKTLINMGNNFNYSDKFDSDLIIQIRNYAGRLEKRLNNVVEKDLSRVDEITKRNDSKIESLKKEKSELLALSESLLKEAKEAEIKRIDKAIEKAKENKKKESDIILNSTKNKLKENGINDPAGALVDISNKYEAELIKLQEEKDSLLSNRNQDNREKTTENQTKENADLLKLKEELLKEAPIANNKEGVQSSNDNPVVQEVVTDPDDAFLISVTSDGHTVHGKHKDWSKKEQDIRKEPDGWHVYKGIPYYKNSYKGGRPNDNLTIWFKTMPSESQKKVIEGVEGRTSSIKEIQDTILDLINEGAQQQAQQSNTPVAPIEVSEKMDEVVKGISELMDGKENLEIKTDVMNSIKDSVRPLHSKKTLTKAELIAILKKQLAEHVTITQEGKKFFISLKSTETVVPLDLNFTDRIATVEQTELQKQVEMEKQAREESERLKAEGNTRVAPTARNLKGIEPSESNKPSLMKTLTKMNTRKHSFLFRKFGVKDDIALMEAIKNHDKLVDPSTLTDQDSIDGLIETMMNCI